MNKIFKVIWCKSSQTWIAVSELSKNKPVSSSANSSDQIDSAVSRLRLTPRLKAALAALPLALATHYASAYVEISNTTNDVARNDDGNAFAGSGKKATATPNQNADSTELYDYLNPGNKSYKDANASSGYKDNYTEMYQYAYGIAIGNSANTIDKTGSSSSIAIGDYANSTGPLSTSIGAFSRAEDIGATAIGTASRAHGFNSLAMMRQSAAIGDYSAAIGSVAYAKGRASFAFGASATSNGDQSIAIGNAAPRTIEGSGQGEANRTRYDGLNNTQSNGNRSVAIGSGAKTNGDDSFAFGSEAKTGMFYLGKDDYLQENVTRPNSTGAEKAIAFGTKSAATGNASVAFGYQSLAGEVNSIAFGVESKAHKDDAIAFGSNANASETNSIAFGSNAQALHENVITIGKDSKATKKGAMSIGESAESNANNSLALGNATVVNPEDIGNNYSRYTNEPFDKENGVVAIANKGKERRLINLAAGSNDTDAVNVKQLTDVNNNLAKSIMGGDYIGYDVDNTTGKYTYKAPEFDIKNEKLDTVKKAVELAQTNYVSVNATAAKDAAGSNYDNKGAQGAGSIALGEMTSTTAAAKDSIAIGHNTNVSGNNTVALGANITATTNGSVILGDSSKVDGSHETKTVTNKQIGDHTYNFSGVAKDAGRFVSVGEKGNERQIKNVAAGHVEENSTDAINGSQLYAVTKRLETGWNITTGKTGTGEVTNNTNETVKMGQTVTIKAGDNVNITQAGKEITVATSATPNFTNATFGSGDDKTVINKDGITINNGSDKTVSLTENGLNNGNNTITNVKDGTNGTDAVNLNQLNNTTQNLTNKGLDFAGDNESVTVHRNLGQKLNVTGGVKDANQLSDNNIGVVGDANGSLALKLAKNINLTDTGSVTIGDTKIDNGGLTITGGPSVKKDGVDAGGKKITNVSNGTADSDAVNLSQLNALGNNTIKLGGDNSSTTNTQNLNKSGGLQFDIVSGDNGKYVSTKASDSKVEVDLTQETKNKIDNAADNNFTNITDDAKNVIKETSAWNVQVNNNSSEKVLGGETVKFINGSNIEITNTGKNITIATSMTPNFTNATFGSDNDKTVIDKDGITITNGTDSNKTVSLTDKGLNNGNNQITNVSSGLGDTKLSEASGDTLNNAANIGDLKNAVTNVTNADNGGGFVLTDDKKTEVKQDLGKSIQVKGKDGVTVTANVADKSLEVALQGDVKVAGKDGKDGSIGVQGKDGKDGVNINGNGTVTVGRDGADGVDGKIGVNGKDGSSVVINGKDGSIGLTGKDGKDGLTIKGAQGPAGVDGTDGKTRLVYETKDKDGKTTTEEVATLNDGLKFTGNNEDTVNKHKLNTLVKVQGEGVTKEASSTFESAAGNINVVANGSDKLELRLAKNLTNITSVTDGTNKIEFKDGNTTISGGDVSVSDNKITNLKDGDVSKDSKDAVNGSQLYEVKQTAEAGWNLTANGENSSNVKPNATVDLNNKDGNIVITKEENNVTFGLANNITIKGTQGENGQDGKDGSIGVQGKDGKDGVNINGNGTVTVGRDGKDGEPGVDGTIGVNGKDGSAVVINGKDGSIGLNGKDGENGLTMKGDKGPAGVDGKDGDTKTRLVYELKDKDGNPVKDSDGKVITENVATLNDGLKFTGNNEVTNIHKLNTLVTVKGEGVDKTASEAFKSATGNINVKADGNGTLEVQLAKDVNLTKDGSVTTGNTKVNNDGITITKPENSNTTDVKLTQNGLDNGGNKITNVAAGDVSENSTDAVNGSQLYNVTNTLTNKGLDFKTQSGETIHKNLGETLDVVGTGEKDDARYSSDNIKTMNKDGKVVIGLDKDLKADTVTVGEKGENGKDGVDGKIGVNGKDGSAVVINGKDGSIGLNGKDGENGLTLKGDKGSVGLDGTDGANGKDGMTRIVYTDGNNTKHEVATLDDGLKFKGDDDKVIEKKLNQQLDIIGGADKDKLTENNIGVNHDNGKLKVQLSKDLNGINTITNGGSKITLNNSPDANDPTKPAVTISGGDLNVDGNKITNVKDGEISATSKDAVNGSQLNKVKQDADQNRTTVKSSDNSIKVEDKGSAGKHEYDITVNNQQVVESAQTPVVYTDKDGNKLYKQADGSFNTTADGKGTKVEPKDVIASINNGENSTTTPMVLNNIGSAIINQAGDNYLSKLDEAAKTTPNAAVNVTDLKNTAEAIGLKGLNFGTQSIGANAEIHKNLGDKLEIVGEGSKNEANYSAENVRTITKDGKVVVALDKDLKANSLTVGENGKDGVDGKIGVNGKDGSAVVINGKDGSIGLTGPKGEDGVSPQATIKVAQGAKGIDGNDGKDGESKTRIVYEKPNGDKEEVATLNDGLRFKGDTGDSIAKKLNEELEILGKADKDADVTDKNLRVDNEDGKLILKMAKTLRDLTSATFTDPTTGNKSVIDGKGLTITSPDAEKDPKKVVSLTDKGLNNGGNQITNVDSGLKDADGKKVDLKNANDGILTNAVNVGDLKESIENITDPTKGGGFGLTDENGKDIKAALGETVTVKGDGSVTTKVVEKDGKVDHLQIGLNKDVTIGDDKQSGTLTVKGKDGKDGVSIKGEDGSIGLKGEDGNDSIALNGKDGTIGLKGADGKDGITLNGKDGTIGINGKDGSNGSITMAQGKAGVDGKNDETKTRIVYETKDKDGNSVKEEVATMNDGLKFVGNDGKEVIRKLNETLSITGGLDKETVADKTKVSNSNIGVRQKDEGGLEIVMKERPEFSGVVVNGKDGKDAEVKFGADGKDGMSIAGKNGKDGIEGLTIRGKDGKDGVTFTQDGRITNVQDGKDGKDAVNKDQLDRGIAQATTKVEAGKNMEVTPTKNADGSTTYTVKTKDDVDFTTVKTGNTTMDNEGITIRESAGGKTHVKLSKEGLDNGGNKIVNVAPGEVSETSTDAVNGSQLHKTEQTLVNKGLDFGTQSGAVIHKNLGEQLDIVGEGQKADSEYSAENVKTITTKDGKVLVALDKNLKSDTITVGEAGKDGKPGVDGKIGVNGKDGSSVVINGKDGSIGLTGPKGADGTTPSITVKTEKGSTTVNEKDGGKSIERIKYTDSNNNTREVATLDDGLKFKGDDNKVINRTLGSQLNIQGGAKDSTTEDNIQVVSQGDNTLKVKLANNIKLNDNGSVKVGQTTVNKDGVTIGSGNKQVSVTENGLNNGGNRITNVAAGRNNTDAVNVSQLKGVSNHFNNRLDDMDKRRKAGTASALATAGLMQVYRPGQSAVTAAIGQYQNQSAVAVGYSRLADSGKYGIKVSFTTNTQSEVGATIGAGYFW